MSKLFKCIFPYTSTNWSCGAPSSSFSYPEDVKNQGFLSPPSTSTPPCELSYHHVDAVVQKSLSKRIQKLENEKKAFVKVQKSYVKKNQSKGKLNYYKIDCPMPDRTTIASKNKKISDESNIYCVID